MFLMRLYSRSPADAKEDYIINAAQGKFASVQRVPGGGHLVCCQIIISVIKPITSALDFTDGPKRSR